ncbi:MAG: hydroxyacid dehydrogenase [Spirochaetaceae bacterium]|nr:MAG: hydroxyacid dehydrogenase [Spirochaetaceae bacterium]
MQKVVVTQALPAMAMRRLEERFKITILESGDEAALIDACRDAEAIVLRTNSCVSRTVIEQSPQLKIVSRTGAGVDNVDVEAATENGILVCNVTGVNSVSVAEHAVTLMLTLLKRTRAMDNAVRTGNWSARRGTKTREISGKTVGIVGMGNVGRKVAEICHNGFGMQVLAYDPYARQAIVSRGYTECDSLEDLFSASDIVTLHCPNIPETRNLANRELLSMMKPSAVLVNTARGEIVDEQALVEMLRDGRVAGAGLDVFADEPPDAGHPLLQMDNVILSPHAAALTEEVSAKVADAAVEAVLDFADGKRPRSVYNQDAL